MLNRLRSARWHIEEPGGLAVLIAWFALLTGFAEAGILLFRRFALHQMIWASGDIAWMAPLAYLFYGALFGILLLCLRKLVTLSRVVFVLGFFTAAVLSLLLLRGWIHVLAQLVLATAAALELARQARRRPEALNRIVMRMTPPLAALLLVLALTMPLGRRISASRALGQLAEAPAGAPNVLLLIWDTVRQRNLSLYGYERPTTPNLERWSRQGTVFDRALAPAPWTLGTHASVFTGLLPQELSITWDHPIAASHRKLAEALGERGYYTAGFVANLINASHETGLGRGFIRYDDYIPSPVTVLLHSVLAQKVLHPDLLTWRIRLYHPVKRATRITDDFLRWLPEAGERPFFAFLNYFDAHDPYFPRPDLRRQFNSGRSLVDRYDAAIATLDQELDRLLAELDRRGVLGNTVVILTSDHGENFGEKGLHGHGNSLYMTQLHVPLVIWRPDREGAGGRVPHPVSLRDLPGTVLDLALGPQAPSFPGRAFAGAWAEPAGSSIRAADTLLAGVPKGGSHAEPNERNFSGNMSSLMAGNLYYIRNGDGVEELYDLASDRAEETNLVGNHGYAGILERLRVAARRRIPSSWLPSVK